MKGKLLIVLMAAILAISYVTAEPMIEIVEVKLDDDVILPTGSNKIYAYEKDQEFEVDIELESNERIRDVQIEAVIRGYDHDDLIEDITDVFDMKADRTYRKTLKLTLPHRMDSYDDNIYKLRIRVDDRDSNTIQETYELEVISQRYDLVIKDVSLFPSNEVEAGKVILGSVRLENAGQKDLDDGVKIIIEVPELGVSYVDYIDEIDEDDSITSEGLYLRIPSDAESGMYEMLVTVEYKDGDRSETVERMIRVIGEEDEDEDDEPEDKPGKTVISIGPTAQDVVPGEGGVIYPMTISNAGDEAKTYIINVEGYEDWAQVRVSPANFVVLQPYEAKAVYVYVTANEDAEAGDHMFMVSVSSGEETLKDFTLTATVTEAEEDGEDSGDETNWSNVRRGLEIGLVILVVLLVILALIIGFSKLKGKESDFDEDEDSSQTYY
jgi:hypothetical protein